MAGNVREKSVACFDYLLRILITITVVKNVSQNIHTYLFNCQIYQIRMIHVEILNYFQWYDTCFNIFWLCLQYFL
jgi:hypothetical protein